MMVQTDRHSHSQLLGGGGGGGGVGGWWVCKTLTAVSNGPCLPMTGLWEMESKAINAL